MTNDEMEKAGMCPECGTPFYDGCFCTPRSVKRATRTKDQADDADAVQYMHSTFGERMRMFYSEPEPSDALNESNEVFDIRSQFRSSPPPPPSPIVPPPPARKPSILYVHPDGTVLKNPPPAGPTIAELIEQANHRANRNPTQSPPQLPDAGPASVPPQSSQSVVPPPPTRKPDVSTWVASKPQPPPVHASEAPARPYTPLPPTAAPQPATTAVSHRRTQAADTPLQQFTPPSQTPRSSYVPTFFALWALLAASMSDRHTPVATAIILGAMLSVFLSFFVSFAIDWLIDQTRK